MEENVLGEAIVDVFNWAISDDSHCTSCRHFVKRKIDYDYGEIYEIVVGKPRLQKVNAYVCQRAKRPNYVERMPIGGACNQHASLQ